MEGNVVVEKDGILLAQAIMNKTRLEILDTLDEPMHISGIAEKMGLDRSTVAYHLNLLKKVGIVSNEYRPLTNPMRGWVGNYFIINREVLEEAIELVEKDFQKVRKK